MSLLLKIIPIVSVVHNQTIIVWFPVYHRELLPHMTAWVTTQTTQKSVDVDSYSTYIVILIKDH